MPRRDDEQQPPNHVRLPSGKTSPLFALSLRYQIPANAPALGVKVFFGS